MSALPENNSDLVCGDCGDADTRPFQIQTRSKKTPFRRLNLCRVCRRNYPKAYRIFGEGSITIPEVGYTTHKRTVAGRNYFLAVHSNGRVVVQGQNVSTGKYGGGYVTKPEALAVLAAVGPSDPRLHLDRAY